MGSYIYTHQIVCPLTCAVNPGAFVPLSISYFFSSYKIDFSKGGSLSRTQPHLSTCSSLPTNSLSRTQPHLSTCSSLPTNSLSRTQPHLSTCSSLPTNMLAFSLLFFLFFPLSITFDHLRRCSCHFILHACSCRSWRCKSCRPV
jgi:hypothetical protein